MNRTIPISILLLFLANALGSMLFLFVDGYEVRREMKEFFRTAEFQKRIIILTLDQDEYAQLSWIDSGREFRWDGKLYDLVKEHRVSNGLVHLQCVQDHKEEKYYKRVGESLAHHVPVSGENTHIILSIFKFLSSLICQSIGSTTATAIVNASGHLNYTNDYHFSLIHSSFQPPDTAQLLS